MADKLFHIILGAGVLFYIIWMIIMLIKTEKKMDELEERAELLARSMNFMNHRNKEENE